MLPAGSAGAVWEAAISLHALFSLTFNPGIHSPPPSASTHWYREAERMVCER